MHFRIGRGKVNGGEGENRVERKLQRVYIIIIKQREAIEDGRDEIIRGEEE